MNKKLSLGILALVLTAVILVSGCTQQTPTEEQEESECSPNWQCSDWSTPCIDSTQTRTCTDANDCNTTINKPEETKTCKQVYSTQSVSTMVTQSNDLPEGWETQENRERFAMDMEESAIENGWKEGHYAAYLKTGDTALEVTRIDHYISKYPLENIQDVLTNNDSTVAFFRQYEKKVVNPFGEGGSIDSDELPSPDIGDESYAFRVLEVDYYANEVMSYSIIFRKMDIYESISITGTLADYGLLKELAQKAEKRVR